uniref:Putative ovule protein n=1 Tax=Solanum chacoense TaxID=4108 RepID=A0A0V0H6U3_SOLCH
MFRLCVCFHSRLAHPLIAARVVVSPTLGSNTPTKLLFNTSLCSSGSSVTKILSPCRTTFSFSATFDPLLAHLMLKEISIKYINFYI